MSMKRREFITLLGGTVAWPLAARAQQQGKVWRIGVLSIGSAATARHLVEAFLKGMADLGYQEGRNVHYEVRYGEGSFEKFEQYARRVRQRQSRSNLGLWHTRRHGSAKSDRVYANHLRPGGRSSVFKAGARSQSPREPTSPACR
jgi:hypothetical protein